MFTLLSAINLGDAIFQLFFFLLVILVPVSLIAIIWFMITMKKRRQQLDRMEEKLDQLQNDKTENQS